jgi:DNA-binding protein HU-beta
LLFNLLRISLTRYGLDPEYIFSTETPIYFTGGEYMAKAMTKSQLVAKVAEKADLSKKAAGEILDHIAEIAYKEAKNSFTLPGLGKLVLVQRKARMGRNPATGETIKIKAKKVVKFRVAKAAKDAILGVKK